MNEMRRRVLRSCIRAASQAKSSEELELVVEDLRSIMEEEEESRENLPENLLSSKEAEDPPYPHPLSVQASETVLILQLIFLFPSSDLISQYHQSGILL